MARARDILSITEWVPIKPTATSNNTVKDTIDKKYLLSSKGIWVSVAKISNVSLLLSDIEKYIPIQFRNTYSNVWVNNTMSTNKIVFVVDSGTHKMIYGFKGRYTNNRLTGNNEPTKWKHILSWDVYPNNDLNDLLDNAMNRVQHLWSK